MIRDNRHPSADVLSKANARAEKMGKAAAERAGKPGYDWAQRHLAAWNGGTDERGRAIVMTLRALAGYADAHRAKFESSIGQDYVLGEGFVDMLKGVRVLLNGECGALDCGTLDGMILGLARVNNINPDTFDLGWNDDDDK